MNFRDKLLLLYSIIATSAYQPSALPSLDQLLQGPVYFNRKHFHNEEAFFVFPGCKKTKNLSCTLQPHDLPRYLYSNGKHTVDRQKKKLNKGISVHKAYFDLKTNT